MERYKKLGKVGEGAHGVVWRAEALEAPTSWELEPAPLPDGPARHARAAAPPSGANR
jgi:hypothetical protein